MFYTTVLTLTLLLALPAASIAENVEETMTAEETTKTTDTSITPKKRMDLKEKPKTMPEDEMKKRNVVKNDIMERRKEAKEEFAKEREAFKTNLKEITDEKKQEIVERVDSHIRKMNEKITEKLAEHLDRISGIIDRIEEKAAESEGDAKAVDDAVIVAREAVETAQRAVSDQAGKEYIIEITDEGNLRADVKSVVTQFRTDIKATVELVKEARQKTIDAARALAQAQGMDKQQEREAPESDMPDELGG